MQANFEFFIHIFIGEAEIRSKPRFQIHNFSSDAIGGLRSTDFVIT